MLQAQDLYLQTRAELHQMSKAYSQLEKEHQALNAKHQDLILNSTPSAIVQDLQQQVDDLTAEIDRRSKEYGQLKKEKLSLSNQVQDLHTQNTHLTQQVSGLKAALLEKNSGSFDKEDDKSCNQECASAQKGQRVRLTIPSCQQRACCLPVEEATAGKAAKAILGSADEQVGVDKSFDEGNDDCRSVPYGTTQIDGRSAPSPLEGAPPHLATLIDEVDGLTQACEDVQDALKVKLKLSAAFMQTGRFSPNGNNVAGRPVKGIWRFGGANNQVEVADNTNELDAVITPQRKRTTMQSLAAPSPPVMTGRTCPASLDFAFSPSRATPSRADLATPAKALASPQAMSQTSPADTLSPLDFTGMPFCDEGWTSSGCPDIFAAADLMSPARMPSGAQSGCTTGSPAFSSGLDPAVALLRLPDSPQDLPQGGFGSPLEVRSESSTQSPASPQDCVQMRSYALFPGVDPAPPVSSSSLALEFDTPASVRALVQVLSGPTPATHQTWTSPSSWGSTPGSAPNSPESFAYLVTPPFTPQAHLLSEAVSPSDQQLQGRQAMLGSQSPVKDISLQGLSKMRTGFGAETLYLPGGILADLHVGSPQPLAPVSIATGNTVSSQAAAKPSVRQAAAKAPTIKSMQKMPTGFGMELQFAPGRILAGDCNIFEHAPASPQDDAHSTCFTPAPSQPELHGTPSRSMLPARTPLSAQSGFTATPPASPGLDSGVAFFTLPVSSEDLPHAEVIQMRSYALFPGVDAAPPVSSSSPALEFATPASVRTMAHVLPGPTPATRQTWTSPSSWGSTPGSATDSRESFAYLVTPPFTPQAHALSDAPSPSDQQLQESGRQGLLNSQSPVRDVSLRGLSKMRTGFGAETLYLPGGILADLYTGSPLAPVSTATGNSMSSQAAAKPSVRQAAAKAPTIKSMQKMPTGFGMELQFAPGRILAGDCNGYELAPASPQDDAAPTCFTPTSPQPQLHSTPARSTAGMRLSALLQHSPSISSPVLANNPKTNTLRPGTACQKTALVGVRTPLAELNMAGSAVSNRAAFSKSTLRKASIGGSAVSVTADHGFGSSPVCKPQFARSAVHHRSSLGRSPLVSVPASATSHRSSCSPPGASPSTPTRADLLTPAGPSGTRHSSLSPGGSSPRVFVHGARLQVPSMLTANSGSSPSSTGGRSTSSQATSAASSSERSSSTPSVTPGPMSNLADACAVAAGTVRPEGTSAQAVRAAGKTRQTRGSTSRPAWSSAFTCTTALHPSPGHSTPHSRQVITPGPSPTASAGRRPCAASHAAGPASVQSHQAIAKLGPARRGNTVAATVMSTARTGPVSKVGTSSPAAASGSACAAKPSIRQTTRATAAAAAGQKASVKPSTSTAQPRIRPTRASAAAAAAAQEASVKPRAAAAKKAPATSCAREPETVAPRRSARLSKLPSRPATTAGQPRATAVARKATAARCQGAAGTDTARVARASTAAPRTGALRAAKPAAARPTRAAAGGITAPSSKPAVAASLTGKQLASHARHCTKGQS
ncbi:hypothetical protein ABBQ32_008538 [Trebouxia sp. C0010 RCD-2024]